MRPGTGKSSLANCEFDQQQEKVLSAWLASCPAGKHGRSMTLSAMKGLMFAVANSPVTVPPDRWMALAMASKTPAFDSPQQENDIRHILFNLLAKVRDTIAGGHEVLPEECRAEDVYSSEFARLQEWSFGYGQGCNLLMDVWSEVLKHPLVQPLAESWSRCLMLLNVWSRADTLLEKAKKKNGPDVNKMLQAMPAGAREMAVMCHDIQATWQEALSQKKTTPDVQTISVTRVSRNEPCPCGSGKKFKKCCGG